MTSPTAVICLPASHQDPSRVFVFGTAAETWQTDALSDVPAALERVDKCLQRGRYVVGMITYEAAPAFDSAIKTRSSETSPLCWFAALTTPIADPDSSLARSLLTAGMPAREDVGFREPKLSIDEPEYVAAVQRALEYIRRGDIYQVNYTVRATLEGTGKPWDLFRLLYAAAPMPHSAYLDLGSEQILSFSPELFLRRRGRIIESRPMKGTAPRRASWKDDEATRLALSADEKNRAENVMIVDLMRNDLGHICELGSVSVPELWRSERFPTVHQMTSLVRGQLREGISLFGIFAATFPPGSVTGAPKIRACERIANLETTPRGIYCGTIGLFLPNGDFECNVAIRTLQTADLPGCYTLGLGSGIVADSDPVEEWQECRVKGRFVTQQPLNFTIYETIRYSGSPHRFKGEDQGGGVSSLPPASAEGTGRYSAARPASASGNAETADSLPFGAVTGHEGSTAYAYLDLHAHLRRLCQSCTYFGWPFPIKDILRQLRRLKTQLGADPARLRVDVDSQGGVEIKINRENLSWPEGGMTVLISDLRLDPADFRLYHKTTLRPEKYEALERARARGAFECLFLNTRGELAEGALSNVILHIEGCWRTPALSCGLLPGVWRENQLGVGRYREAVLSLADLARADEIRMVNAVRGEGRVLRILDSEGNAIYDHKNNPPSREEQGGGFCGGF